MAGRRTDDRREIQFTALISTHNRKLRINFNNDPDNFVRKYQLILGYRAGVRLNMDQTFNFKERTDTTCARQSAEQYIQWKEFKIYLPKH